MIVILNDEARKYTPAVLKCQADFPIEKRAEERITDLEAELRKLRG